MAPIKSTKEAPTSAPADMAPRFGIAEWYGQSFADIDESTRKALASFSPEKGNRLKKTERERILELESLEAAGQPLTAAQSNRLSILRAKKKVELATNKRCPFRGQDKDAICTKEGGVCSLRLYENAPSGIKPVRGERGAIRALCPVRFHEADEIVKWVGDTILGTDSPTIAREVGFLESGETVDGSEGEDVGRLDMILVDGELPEDHPMHWCALEIQAVYFSGKEMPKDFVAIAADPGNGLIWPTEVRRPDYRSSGPKRLMPQLQIKVPTLRRWGKKMAVVVDRAFFDSMGSMDRIDEPSNADIAWFIADFEYVPAKKSFRIKRGEIVFTTLEEAVDGLTGGKPVSKDEFETRIRARLRSG